MLISSFSTPDVRGGGRKKNVGHELKMGFGPVERYDCANCRQAHS